MLTNYKVAYTIKTVSYHSNSPAETEVVTTHEYITPSNDYSEIFTDIYYLHRKSTLKGIEILAIDEQ